MPVRSMTLTTKSGSNRNVPTVSDACQINDFDHTIICMSSILLVSDACQINDFDHITCCTTDMPLVSDACQINDFDHTVP